MRMMRPLWRGAWLALAILLLLVYAGSPEMMDKVRLNDTPRTLLIFAGMTVLGALIAAIPDRIRRRRKPAYRSSLVSCSAAFTGGVLATLGLSLAQAGDLHMLSGVMQGGLGSMAFLGCAWAAAMLTARVMGRWL